MLRFDHPMRSTTKVHRTVSEALDYFLAWLLDKGETGTAKQLSRYQLTCFTFAQLGTEANRLLAAHEDKANVYYLTEYHWLLLDRVIKHAFTAHNRRVVAAGKAGSSGKKPPVLQSIGQHRANSEAFRGTWFWDTDYDLPPDLINAMSKAQKEFAGFTEGTFACINRLPVHHTDLVMKQEPLRGREKADSW